MTSDYLHSSAGMKLEYIRVRDTIDDVYGTAVWAYYVGTSDEMWLVNWDNDFQYLIDRWRLEVVDEGV